MVIAGFPLRDLLRTYASRNMFPVYIAQRPEDANLYNSLGY
jgi:hypothetical protein